MKEVLDLFIEELKKKDHIVPILKGASVTIGFWTGTKYLGMLIKENQLDFLASKENEHLDVKISGDETEIKAVLLGQTKLREAIHNKQLTISSSFRNLLFLETLFYLSKTR